MMIIELLPCVRSFGFELSLSIEQLCALCVFCFDKEIISISTITKTALAGRGGQSAAVESICWSSYRALLTGESSPRDTFAPFLASSGFAWRQGTSCESIQPMCAMLVSFSFNDKKKEFSSDEYF